MAILHSFRIQTNTIGLTNATHGENKVLNSEKKIQLHSKQMYLCCGRTSVQVAIIEKEDVLQGLCKGAKLQVLTLIQCAYTFIRAINFF